MKKEIARKVLAEVTAEYDFNQDIQASREELLGIEQQISTEGIIKLDEEIGRYPVVFGGEFNRGDQPSPHNLHRHASRGSNGLPGGDGLPGFPWKGRRIGGAGRRQGEEQEKKTCRPGPWARNAWTGSDRCAGPCRRKHAAR